jgi:hypothetical protein
MGALKSIGKRIATFGLVSLLTILPGCALKHNSNNNYYRDLVEDIEKPDRKEYKQGLEEFAEHGDTAIQLKQALGEDFSLDKIPQYSSLLSQYGNDVVEVAEIFGSEFTSLDTNYLSFTIENIDRLSTTYEEIGRNLNLNDLHDFEDMSSFGLSDLFITDYLQLPKTERDIIFQDLLKGQIDQLSEPLAKGLVVDSGTYHEGIFVDEMETGIDIVELQANIEAKLLVLDHTYRTYEATRKICRPAGCEDGFNLLEDPSQIYEVNDPYQLLTINNYLNFLTTSEGANTIGNLMLEDLDDKESEHSGLIINTEGGKPFLLPVAPLPAKVHYTSIGSIMAMVFSSREMSNAFYVPYYGAQDICTKAIENADAIFEDYEVFDHSLFRSDFSRAMEEFGQITSEERIRSIRSCLDTCIEQDTLIIDYFPMIGGYHFHASGEDGTIYAGPSGFPEDNKGDIGRLFPEDNNPRNPHAIQLVFSKLPGNEFNADAYMRVNEDTAIVVDLGNYEFEVVN